MYTTRRKFLAGAAGAMALARVSGASSRSETNATARRPNVVLILSDDQHWGDYGFMGHPVCRTPNLDRLASESMVFTRGYVTSALCLPSLATLTTGLHDHQHAFKPVEQIGSKKEYFWQARERRIEYFKQAETLPRILARHGYRSFQSGKWWEGSYADGGFTHGMSHGVRDPKVRGSMLMKGGRHGDVGLAIGRETMQPVFDFIDESGDQPFYLWYAPIMPHLPHNPPKQFLEAYEGLGLDRAFARYYAMCTWFDETCGQLLDYLDQKGLSENTLVVFLADNGWIPRPARAPNPSGWRVPPAPKSKYSPYDGGVRTPIMLRWPGRLAPGRDTETPVSSVDYVPTVLSACGIEPPTGLPGLNVLDTQALQAREAIFGADYGSSFDRSKAQEFLHYRWCVSGTYKLLVPHVPGVGFRQLELYDVLADPHETMNLATEEPDVARRLLTLVNAWWR